MRGATAVETTGPRRELRISHVLVAKKSMRTDRREIDRYGLYLQQKDVYPRQSANLLDTYRSVVENSKLPYNEPPPAIRTCPERSP